VKLSFLIAPRCFSVLILALATGSADAESGAGAALFQQRCAVCHSVVAGQNKIGPHLAGVIGRKAGSVKDARYSAAMKASGIVWTARSLDPYLAAPAKVVPGTQMMINVPDPAQRAAIIAYLGNGK
jgi:cytochrome c